MPTEMRLIVCTFDATGRAEEVKDALKALDRKLDSIKLGNIALVEKFADGQIGVRETQDHRDGISRVTGAVTGAVGWFVYAFAGSLGYQAGPLAFEAGYNTAERLVQDAGFPDSALREIGEHLDAGSSALITLVKAEEQPIVVEELQRLGGHLIEHDIPPEIAKELTKGEE
jgi:uncharacterized membrane protein